MTTGTILIPMSQRELHRYHTLRLALERRITGAQAAQSLGCSERHVWRLLARLRSEGRRGVVHGNRGRPSGPRLKKGPETVRQKLGVLPSDPANRERLRAAGATFEHCRRAKQLLGRTEIASAEQERFWVDLVVEASRKRWSVREMWRAGQERYRLRMQRTVPGLIIKPWEPVRQYNICDQCGQTWGAHLCAYRELDRGGALPQAPAKPRPEAGKGSRTPRGGRPRTPK